MNNLANVTWKLIALATRCVGVVLSFVVIRKIATVSLWPIRRDFLSHGTGERNALGQSLSVWIISIISWLRLSGYVCRDQSANRVRKKQQIEEETLSRLRSCCCTCRVASQLTSSSRRPRSVLMHLAFVSHRSSRRWLEVTRLELIFGNGPLARIA